jgi:hypothetical protein
MMKIGILSLALSFPILLVAGASLSRRVTCPDGVNTAMNAACCEFFSLRDDLQANL